MQQSPMHENKCQHEKMKREGGMELTANGRMGRCCHWRRRPGALRDRGSRWLGGRRSWGGSHCRGCGAPGSGWVLLYHAPWAELRPRFKAMEEGSWTVGCAPGTTGLRGCAGEEARTGCCGLGSSEVKIWPWRGAAGSGRSRQGGERPSLAWRRRGSEVALGY